MLLRASFEGDNLPTQFRGHRAPPHKPERLRTVVGIAGERDRSSSSAVALAVATKGECRSNHLCSVGLDSPSCLIRIPSHMLVLPSWINRGFKSPFEPPSLRLFMYNLTNRSEAPDLSMGNVIRTVLAVGRTPYGSRSLLSGSNSNLIVESRPDRLVAEWDIPRSLQSFMRNVEVQPAPRIRMSTGIG